MEFRFCPICSTPLVVRLVFNRRRSTCPDCGFVHFRDPKVAVIALTTSSNHVLLVRRAVNPERGRWALPGGFMDAGETPEEALARELREEVGLDVAIEDLLGIYPLSAPPGSHGGIVLAYHAVPDGPTTPALLHNDDVDDAGWFARDTLPEDIAFESTNELLKRWKKQQI